MAEAGQLGQMTRDEKHRKLYSVMPKNVFYCAVILIVLTSHGLHRSIQHISYQARAQSCCTEASRGKALAIVRLHRTARVSFVDVIIGIIFGVIVDESSVGLMLA